MPTKKKVVVYVVKDERLLVFRHVDFTYEQVGIQVPAGSVKDDENLEVAALRELQEETGYKGYKIVRYLGTAIYNKAPQILELHERHFYLAESTEELPERWKSTEDHDGLQPSTHFECFWIPLKYAHILEAGLGTLLGEIHQD